MATLDHPQAQRPLCAFCGRTFSSYTCPSCNAGYCSLSCYRSEAHSQCTEAFYRKEVEEQIRAEPSKTIEDKRHMMEMLKRLEEESGDADATESDDDGSEIDDLLETRLANLDIDSLDSDALWALLNDEEKAAFSKVLQDPDGSEAQSLLAVHSLEIQTFRPWWGDAFDIPDQSERPKPVMMDVPQPPGAIHAKGPNLIFNLFAIVLAYAFTTRHLASSPLASATMSEEDLADARSDIARTAPFLAERRSTMVFERVEQVVTEVWSRLDSTSTTHLIQLLRDALVLLQPRAAIDTSTATPLLLALSDLHALFSSSPTAPHSSTLRSAPNHVALKVAFYVTKAATFSLSALSALCASIQDQIEILRQERDGAVGDGGGIGRSAGIGSGFLIGQEPSPSTRTGPKLIEEIE